MYYKIPLQKFVYKKHYISAIWINIDNEGAFVQRSKKSSDRGRMASYYDSSAILFLPSQGLR
jgi:hypothetical protein